MIIRYKYGFRFDAKLYGWKNKELYRLPQIIGTRFYPLKKCGKWSDKGYYLGSKRKSHTQLLSMTCFINFETEQIKDSDVPF